MCIYIYIYNIAGWAGVGDVANAALSLQPAKSSNAHLLPLILLLLLTLSTHYYLSYQ